MSAGLGKTQRRVLEILEHPHAPTEVQLETLARLVERWETFDRSEFESPWEEDRYAEDWYRRKWSASVYKSVARAVQSLEKRGQVVSHFAYEPFSDRIRCFKHVALAGSALARVVIHPEWTKGPRRATTEVILFRALKGEVIRSPREMMPVFLAERR